LLLIIPQLSESRLTLKKRGGCRLSCISRHDLTLSFSEISWFREGVGVGLGVIVALAEGISDGVSEGCAVTVVVLVDVAEGSAVTVPV
jgi:hypothetical protein